MKNDLPPQMTCWFCFGTGKVESHNPAVGAVLMKPCPICGGSGKIPRPPNLRTRNWPYHQSEIPGIDSKPKPKN